MQQQQQSITQFCVSDVNVKQQHLQTKRYEFDDGQSWILQAYLPKSLRVSLMASTDTGTTFNKLWDMHPQSLGKVRHANHEVSTPRWTQNYGHPYWYSGMLHSAVQLPDELQPYLEWANHLGYGSFQQTLVNWYQDGSHYIGRHSDNEHQLVPRSPIVSVSIGAERTFRIRSKATGAIVLDVPCPHNSYIVMGGCLQMDYTHEVPKINGAKGAAIGPRINITFRKFID